jgi:hypothetical protein
MLRSRPAIILAVFVMMSSLQTIPSAGQTKPDQVKGDPNNTRLLAALEKTGYSYRKASEGIWVVSLTGKNLKEIDVIVQAVEDSVLLQTQVVERKAVVGKEALLVKLLEFNHEYDTAKFALSEEMLYARIDLHARLVDADELKHLVNALALMADEAYPQIKPLLGAK